jgi:UDP-N-acetylglucosamine:LPS N-acetylglucosamine transferase
MSQTKKLTICVVASPGGHLTQIMRISRAWEGYSAFYVSTSLTAANFLAKQGRFFIIEESGRGRIFNTIKCFFQCLRIIIKEKPNVIISGGSGCGSFLCIIGKMFGAKTLWLDSIANVDRMSLSGRVTRPFVDLFIVQWPKHADKYRDVQYKGQVI